MTALIDLTGCRFGRLEVLERAAAEGRPTRWLCRCACGTTKVIRGGDLRSGATRSCGCALSDAAKARVAVHGVPDNTRHGHGAHRAGRRTPTYVVWSNLIQRTTNPRHPYWDSYGGRGITVCDRWRDFSNFLADMGEKPDGLTIDRIDNDGGYEPGNCRWATWSQQRRNQRRRKAS